MLYEPFLFVHRIMTCCDISSIGRTIQGLLSRRTLSMTYDFDLLIKISRGISTSPSCGEIGDHWLVIKSRWTDRRCLTKTSVEKINICQSA